MTNEISPDAPLTAFERICVVTLILFALVCFAACVGNYYRDISEIQTNERTFHEYK